MRFAFTQLPADFTLGRIVLGIADVRGPAPMAGDAAASVLRATATMEVTSAALRGDALVSPDLDLQRTRDGDALVVDPCPVLKSPGRTADVWLRPSFQDIARRDIVIETTLDQKPPPEAGVQLSLSHPKNADLKIVTVFSQGVAE